QYLHPLPAALAHQVLQALSHLGATIQTPNPRSRRFPRDPLTGAKVECPRMLLTLQSENSKDAPSKLRPSFPTQRLHSQPSGFDSWRRFLLIALTWIR